MGTRDSSTLQCGAQGCLYDSDEESGGFLCRAHWGMLPGHLCASILGTPQNTHEWLQLAKQAVSLLHQRALAFDVARRFRQLLQRNQRALA